MCSLKRKSVSIVIPKSMTEFMGILLIWMDCDFCDWPIWRMLHMECEICICHTEDQTCIFSSSYCKLFWVWLVYSVYNLMSSAKSLTVVLGLKWSVISFTNKLNNKLPITLPWITPLVTEQADEYVEFILTTYDLLVRNDFIHKRRLSRMP